MSKTAFIFSGQGAQKAGMGKDFYENSPIAKEIFDKASDILGLDMKALCFEENVKLDITEYTQAALVTTCMAMEKTIEEKGIKPSITAGLSLGEYCAIATAGAISVTDAIAAVRQRGIFMQEEVPTGVGAMAAIVGLDKETIEATISDIEDVTIANYNCPGQIVITGKTNAVESACESLKAAGAKRAIMLNVSGPFHSPLLKGAGEKLRTVLEKINFNNPEIPYVTNVTADYVTSKEKIIDLLSAQVASSVRWQQSMEMMIKDGVDTFVEIGPGKTLAGFLKKIDKTVKVVNVQTWEDMESLWEKLQ